MQTFLFTAFVVMLLLGFISFGMAVTILITGEKHEYKSSIKFFLLVPIFVAISFTFSHYWDIGHQKEVTKRETNATYYAVTKEMKKEIIEHCEKDNIKISQQELCKDLAKDSLKHGEEYEGLKPSTIIVKPSGVVPK